MCVRSMASTLAICDSYKIQDGTPVIKAGEKETYDPTYIGVKVFQRFVPCIKSIPEERQKDECWIIVLSEYVVPVNGMTNSVQACVKC